MARVSASSVSRYFNTPELLAGETKQRIEEAIKQLNYKPNMVARTLRTQKSNKIAMIIPTISNMLYIDLYQELQRAAMEKGLTVMIFPIENTWEMLVKYLDEIPQMDFDGLIVCYLDEENIVEKLRQTQENIPLVLLSNDPYKTGFNMAFMNVHEAIYQSTNYLLNQGRERIAFVGAKKDSLILKEKYKGYRLALERAGHAFNPDYEFIGKINHFQTGFIAMHKFLGLVEIPDGIVCANDDIAIGCIKQLQANHIHIPDQVAVIGLNGISILNTYAPSISSIVQPIGQISRTMIDMLVENIKFPHAKKKRVDFKGKLVARGSTDKDAVEYFETP